ncbi:DNA-formamidopyrimidine glycosylase [Candidatus Phytoplasma fraxini]|uniref:Formamidopyrimidine-DNA glycosylase n=1 Tax=Ash yellows phytoplasma TaxID=35780 RepID=A0ABZ2UAA6_ASHYP
MPELPEVEVTIRHLKQKITNHQIQKIQVFHPPSFKSLYDLDNIKQKTFLDIQRKGKFLLFFLEHDWVIVGHFRMEGKIYIHSPEECNIIHKYENFRIFLDKNKILRYYDFRKFGRFSLHKKDKYLEESGLNQLALDPFEIIDENLWTKIQKKKTKIKQILLNQKIISGIGNIYASEILFLSRIHPEKIANSLNIKQIKIIISKSKEVLQKAIDHGGTSISSFEALGVKGLFQKQLLVYKRDKLNCFICQNKIEKKKIGGRSSYFCSQCQKL